MWDDETCLRFAEAYDREDAAQRGEPSPHAEKGEGYAEWAADRVACVRAGLSAVPAPAVPDDVAVEILTRTAARADAAEAENKRLREALQDIMADRPSEKHNGNRNDLIAWQMWRRARAALTQPTGDRT